MRRARLPKASGWTTVAARHRELYRRVVNGAPDARLRVVYLHPDGQLSADGRALLAQVSHLSAVNAHVILGEDGPLAARLQTAGISVEVCYLPALPAKPSGARSRIAAPTPGGRSRTRWASCALHGACGDYDRTSCMPTRSPPPRMEASQLDLGESRSSRTCALWSGPRCRQDVWAANHAPCTSPRRRRDHRRLARRARRRLRWRSAPTAASVTAVIVDVATAGEDDGASDLAAEVERQIMTVYGAVLARAERRTTRDGAAA